MPTVSNLPPPPPGIKVEGLEEFEQQIHDSFQAPRRRAARNKRPDPKPQTQPEEKLAAESTPAGIPANKVEEAFAQILSLPAIAYKAPGVPWHCDWCATHFAKQGPATAKELVENRSHYPALYSAMEKVAAAWMAFSLMPMVIQYVAPPIIHHGPDVLEPVGPLFGVPPKVKVEPTNNTKRHEHTTASEGTIPGASQPKI